MLPKIGDFRYWILLEIARDKYEFCPVSHPFAFNNGNKCCERNIQPNSEKDGEVGIYDHLFYNKDKCLGDNEKNCDTKPCYTRSNNLEQVLFWADPHVRNSNCRFVLCLNCLLLFHSSIICVYKIFITVVSYQSERFSSKWELPSLLSPFFITRGRMGARGAALILMKISHFDRTPD